MAHARVFRIAILFVALLGCLVVFGMFLEGSVSAIENPGQALDAVGVKPELGTKVDLGLTFTKENGSRVTLRELVGADGRPVIIIPVYYHCPRLCGFLLSGVVDLLNKLPFRLGQDYRAIAVSFDSSESFTLAAEKGASYRSQLASGDGSAWSFLVGDEPNVSALMKSIGFRYVKDGAEFAHTSAIMILTPHGEVSQYFTGIEFSPWDVKLALVEASRGAIGSSIDHFLLYCFRFDPTKGKYTWVAFNVMRTGGVLTLLALAAFFVFIVRRPRREAGTEV